MKTLICEFHKIISKIIIDEEQNTIEFYTIIWDTQINHKIEDQAHIELIVAVLTGAISATAAHKELSNYVSSGPGLNDFDVKQQYPAGRILLSMILLDQQRFIDAITEKELWSTLQPEATLSDYKKFSQIKNSSHKNSEML